MHLHKNKLRVFIVDESRSFSFQCNSIKRYKTKSRQNSLYNLLARSLPVHKSPGLVEILEKKLLVDRIPSGNHGPT